MYVTSLHFGPVLSIYHTPAPSSLLTLIKFVVRRHQLDSSKTPKANRGKPMSLKRHAGKRNLIRASRAARSRVSRCVRSISRGRGRTQIYFFFTIRLTVLSSVEKHFQLGSALATDFHYRYNIKQWRILAQAETTAYLSQRTFKDEIYLLILFIKSIF